MIKKRILFVTSAVCCLLIILTGCSLFGTDAPVEEPLGPPPELPGEGIPGTLVASMRDSAESRNFQIFTINPDGSSRTQLTHFDSDESFEPAWSPDGQQIVFKTSLNSTTAAASLYLMNADGSNLRPMKIRPNTTIPQGGSNPEWSPDGSKIAFEACQNCEVGGGNSEIFVYEFATNAVTQVTDHPASDRHPAWSPDGQTLSFSSDREYFDASEERFRRDLYTVDLNTGKKRRITTTGNAFGSTWHPAGQTLIYEANLFGNSIFSVSLDNLSSKKIDTGLEFSGAPDFSTDGNFLFVAGKVSEKNGPRQFRVFHVARNTFRLIEKETSNQYAKEIFGLKWFFRENTK